MMPTTQITAVAPITLSDWEGDTTPDYLDSDSDDDSVPDVIEGHDADSDGIPDWDTDSSRTLNETLADLDNDGLWDLFDPDYITCTATNFSQSSNGGCASTQDTDGAEDHDWRDINDENDQFLTIDEHENVYNDPDIWDYLEAPCPDGEILVSDIDSIFAQSVIQAIVNGSDVTTGNGLKILGEPDNDHVGDFKKNSGDVVIINMGQLIDAGSIVKIFNQTWESGGVLDVEFSTDNISWSTITSIPRPASSTSVTYSSTFNSFMVSLAATQDFRYIRLTHSGSDGKKIKTRCGSGENLCRLMYGSNTCSK